MFLSIKFALLQGTAAVSHRPLVTQRVSKGTLGIFLPPDLNIAEVAHGVRRALSIPDSVLLLPAGLTRG